MSEIFKLEIVNPEKLFISKDDISEAVIPAFEGEMGILKDHISTISFLKPGIIKLYSKSSNESFYVEDGIAEFKDNNLTILTSRIINIKDMTRNLIDEFIKEAEQDSNNEEINDQEKYLINQKVDLLKSLSLN